MRHVVTKKENNVLPFLGATHPWKEGGSYILK